MRHTGVVLGSTNGCAIALTARHQITVSAFRHEILTFHRFEFMSRWYFLHGTFNHIFCSFPGRSSDSCSSCSFFD